MHQLGWANVIGRGAFDANQLIDVVVTRVEGDPSIPRVPPVGGERGRRERFPAVDYCVGGSNRWSVLTRCPDIVCIEKAARTQLRHYFRKGGSGDREAAFAATEHAEMTDHLVTDVPGAVHDDAPSKSVVIALLQSFEPNRMAMGADIGRTGPIGPFRARVRAWRIGEALEPPSTQWVGTPSVRDEMRTYGAVGEIHQMKSRRTRGQREIGNRNAITVGDAVAMSVQRIQRAQEQRRRQRAIGAVRTLAACPGNRRTRS